MQYISIHMICTMIRIFSYGLYDFEFSFHSILLISFRNDKKRIRWRLNFSIISSFSCPFHVVSFPFLSSHLSRTLFMSSPFPFLSSHLSRTLFMSSPFPFLSSHLSRALFKSSPFPFLLGTISSFFSSSHPFRFFIFLTFSALLSVPLSF